MNASEETPGGQLGRILQANERFVSSFSPTQLPSTPSRGLAIVACMDCRLTGGYLEEALGLQRGEAVMIRNAGNSLSANDDVLRSLVVAVYVLGVREVVVVGHTGCGMAGLDATALLDAMAAAGVPRNAIPSSDLHAWMGAFGNVEGNVAQTVDGIRRSGLFPQKLQVHGLVIDTLTGKVRQVP